jgi:pimeloyl-ACP methyl ester carboxylesterase
MQLILFFIRLFFKTFSFLAPKFAAYQAFELFQKPHMEKTRERELALYKEFSERRIPADKEDLYVYESGDESGYPIILIHGWESNPGSMLGIANSLIEKGFRLIILGLPAHGKSKLKKTNMVHSSEMVKKLIDHYGFKKDFSMITHSFGSGVTSLALKDEEIYPDKLIFMTTPDRIWDIFTQFAETISLGEKAFKYLVDQVEKLSPISLSDFNISELVQKVNYTELFVIHDKFDKILPYKNALNMKALNPKLTLYPTENKGHYRLLWDPEVIELIGHIIEKKS